VVQGGMSSIAEATPAAKASPRSRRAASASPAFRVFGKLAGEILGTKSVEAIGHGGERERAALHEFGGHTFEISHDTRSIRKLFAERRASNRNASEIYGNRTGMAMEGTGFSVKPEYRISSVFPPRR
jgi:hypothetical protein